MEPFFNCERQGRNWTVGLGAFLVERSFFPKNERNDQEQSHRSEKKTERLERILKNIETIVVKERNDFKKVGTCPALIILISIILWQITLETVYYLKCNKALRQTSWSEFSERLKWILNKTPRKKSCKN